MDGRTTSERIVRQLLGDKQAERLVAELRLGRTQLDDVVIQYWPSTIDRPYIGNDFSTIIAPRRKTFMAIIYCRRKAYSSKAISQYGIDKEGRLQANVIYANVPWFILALVCLHKDPSTILGLNPCINLVDKAYPEIHEL